MKLNNMIIYNQASALKTHFSPEEKMIMPVKLYFYLQKNMSIMFDAASEIDKMRLAIAQKYGVLNEASNSYDINPEHINVVNNELQDLFSIEQDLPLHIFKLEDFDGLEFTFAQMNALMFMIEE